MAVTVYWIEYITGETPGTTDHNLGIGEAYAYSEAHTVTNATNLNFGNTSARALTPATYPIAAGSNSYSKYFKLMFSGSYTQISNAKLWASTSNYVTDEYIWFSGNVDYAAPATAEVLSGEPDAEWTDFGVGRRIPTSQPSNNNVVLTRYAQESAGTSASTMPTANETEASPGYYSGSYSATIVFQLTTSASSPAGPVNQKTISLTYDRQ